MIKATALHYAYRNKGVSVDALRGVDLSVAEGEFLAIIGRNSSGKTTLARHLNGLLVPTQGSVLVDGFDSRNPHNMLMIRQLVGMVLSNPENQIVATVVDEDVAFGPENLRLPPTVIHERVGEALTATGLITARKRNPRHLSSGQKQLLATAGILAMRPRYLVFDEVTSMLDPTMQAAILELAIQLHRDEGKSIIWVTHRLDEVLYADRVIVMDQGRISLEGPPHQVFSHQESLHRMGLQVPDLVAVALELRELGFLSPTAGFSVEAIVECLCG